jgi:hypothetical protein
VGFHIAMQAPEQVLGLIVQNGNAHRRGWGRNGTLCWPTGRSRTRRTRRRQPRI